MAATTKREVGWSDVRGEYSDSGQSRSQECETDIEVLTSGEGQGESSGFGHRMVPRTRCCNFGKNVARPARFQQPRGKHMARTQKSW